MGFGEYDGTLDSAEKHIGKVAGCRGLLPCALSRNGLKLFGEVVGDRLERARNGLLHSGICLGELERKRTQEASPTPHLWRALLQMLKKGKCLFNRVHHSDVRSICQH